MFPILSLPDERHGTLRSAGFAALLSLAAMLPFELERPLLPLGLLVLTNVEVLLAAVLLSLIHISEPTRPY